MWLSRAAKERCDAGYGVNATGEAVYLDFKSAIERYGLEQAKIHGIQNASKEKITELGAAVVEEKYGNLFKCTRRSLMKIHIKPQ